jgi:hypothetical protein
MTTKPLSDDLVTRSDREAAISFIQSEDCPVSVKMVLGYSIEPLVQAFARHRLASTQDSQGREAEAISTASEGDGLDRLYPEAYHLMLNFYCDRDFYNSDPSCRPADNVLMAIQYTLWSRCPNVASNTAPGVRVAAASNAAADEMRRQGFSGGWNHDALIHAILAALSASPSDGAGS